MSDAAGHEIFKREPLDDSGVPTQSRFSYQHHCTARLLFAMLGNAAVDVVSCDLHEDILIAYADGTVELVSVKHRDDRLWRLSPLRDVVVGLFRRWQHTGRVARCRLMTNAALAGGARQARQFVDACHASAPAAWIDDAKSWTGSADAAEVKTFLCRFSVDHATGDREHIGAINREHVVVPSLRNAGLEGVQPPVAYDRVLRLVERCSRDEPRDADALLRYLADPERGSPTARQRARLGRRCIDRDRVVEAILDEGPAEAGVQLTFDAPPEPASKLTRKLESGGFGPNTISAAQILRANWAALEARWRADAPGGDPTFADLRARATVAAAQAERTAAGSGDFAVDMHRELEQRFTVESLARRPPFTIDDELLLGLLYELTDECRVWWSRTKTL